MGYSMKYAILFTFVLTACSPSQKDKGFELVTLAQNVSAGFQIEEIKLRAKVKKERGEDVYSLEFSEEALTHLLENKPDRLSLDLPFLQRDQFLVPLRYRKDGILAQFRFPAGWLDGSELEASYYARGKIGYLVSASAIYSPLGKETYVFKLRDTKAEKIPVTVVGVKDSQLIVIGNLSAGDTILTSRLGEVSSNIKVTVKL